MDLAAIIAKITGAVLLLVTLRSIYRHFARKQGAARARGAAQTEAKSSVSEMILNNLLLYLWLVFMVVFSTGMIVNN
jgi:hypothetical protein